MPFLPGLEFTSVPAARYPSRGKSPRERFLASIDKQREQIESGNVGRGSWIKVRNGTMYLTPRASGMLIKLDGQNDSVVVENHASAVDALGVIRNAAEAGELDSVIEDALGRRKPRQTATASTSEDSAVEDTEDGDDDDGEDEDEDTVTGSVE